jgi:hypothetical protein
VAAHHVEEALRIGGEAVDVGRPVGGMTLAFAQGCRSQALLAAGRTEEAARGFVAATQATRDVGVVPYELGWTALSLLPLFPEVGAAVLGATDALFAANGDPDVYPPEDLLAPARTAYETEYAEQLARGRDLGWPEVVTLLDDLDLG